MGFFSFLADGNESIANVHSGRPVKTVYLLRPNGKAALCEPAYGGYGLFAGEDCHDVLAEQNFGVKSRSLGIFAEVGHFYSDSEHYFFCSMHMDQDDLKHIESQLDPSKRVVFFGNYSEKMEAFGANMNEMVEHGLVKKERIEVKYPLKFSFSPDTDYDSAPAALQDPAQGYFY